MHRDLFELTETQTATFVDREDVLRREAARLRRVCERPTKPGMAGFKRDVADCLLRAKYLALEFRPLGVRVPRNPLSLTVVFPASPKAMIGNDQRLYDKGWAQAIVMPNVGNWLIDRFLEDYAGWWRAAGTAAPMPIAAAV